MKRFASHYLLIPAIGYMKQQVVEITDEGAAVDVWYVSRFGAYDVSKMVSRLWFSLL